MVILEISGAGSSTANFQNITGWLICQRQTLLNKYLILLICRSKLALKIAQLYFREYSKPSKKMLLSFQLLTKDLAVAQAGL